MPGAEQRGPTPRSLVTDVIDQHRVLFPPSKVSHRAIKDALAKIAQGASRGPSPAEVATALTPAPVVGFNGQLAAVLH